MKKYGILCLFLCLLLTACGGSEELADPGVADKPRYAGTDLGVSIACEDVTPTGMTLVFTRSGTAGELITGSYYNLEAFTNDGWQAVELLERDAAWTSIAYIIEEEGESRFPENWEWLYGELTDGSYRIGKEIYGENEKCTVYGYFTLPAAEADYTHALASEPLTVEDPVSGYCGNTVTTVYLEGEEYSFWGSDSVTLTDILINLDYDPGKLCDCAVEFTVDTEFATGYGVNLGEGFARCEDGQAELTLEQLETIQGIVEELH